MSSYEYESDYESTDDSEVDYDQIYDSSYEDDYFEEIEPFPVDREKGYSSVSKHGIYLKFQSLVDDLEDQRNRRVRKINLKNIFETQEVLKVRNYFLRNFKLKVFL